MDFNLKKKIPVILLMLFMLAVLIFFAILYFKSVSAHKSALAQTPETSVEPETSSKPYDYTPPDYTDNSDSDNSQSENTSESDIISSAFESSFLSPDSSSLSSLLSSSALTSKSSKSSLSSAKSTSSRSSSQPQASRASSSSSTSVSGKLGVKVNGVNTLMDEAAVIAVFTSYEVSSGYHEEAIKAQAVASATYISYRNTVGEYPVLPDKTVDSKIKEIVKKVTGKRIYYRGSVINAVYHASSAGRTNSCAEVWGGNNVPYLVSVEGKYDKNDPNWDITKTFSAADVQKMASENAGITLSGSPSDWFKIINYTSGGYVNDMQVGSSKTTGHRLRESVLTQNGARQIKSACFTVKAQKDNIGKDILIFKTRGYGHGVGMSQSGANFYAKNDNMSYVDILKHYYTGVEVK